MACVSALLASSVALEVLVVDNGSSDQSIERLRAALGEDVRLTIIENRRNLGFAKANNIALSKARGEYVLLVNPDCLVGSDSLAQMTEVLRAHPEVGMAGPLVLNSDGSEQAGCRRAEPTPWRAFSRAFGLRRLRPKLDFVLTGQPLPTTPIEVDAISGAFMFARRSDVDQVGWLDEGYFLHCEDLDWCHRFRSAGKRVLFVPQVKVTHAKGRSSDRNPIRVLYYKHQGMGRYYRKFYRQGSSMLLTALVLAGVWLRFGVLALLALPRSVRSS